MYFRRRLTGKPIKIVDVGRLRPGDCVEMRTSNSYYKFWVEFPDLAIGVCVGGRLTSPTRVRLTPEGTASNDARVRPLRLGERVQIVALGPDGRPIRRFLTSQLAEVALASGGQAAA
jgi:hypothetical protein